MTIIQMMLVTYDGIAWKRAVSAIIFTVRHRQPQRADRQGESVSEGTGCALVPAPREVTLAGRHCLSRSPDHVRNGAKSRHDLDTLGTHD
jgi:hypothetical protein